MPVPNLMVTPEPSSDASSNSQKRPLTKPWEGCEASAGCALNHGQQTGMPPRIAFPSRKTASVLRYRTSSSSTGRYDITCAPCKATRAEHVG